MRIQSTNINFGTKYSLIPASTLKELLDKQYTYKQIADVCGVPLHIVNRSMRYKISKEEPKIIEHKKEIIQLYKDGFSSSYIGSILGVDKKLIKKVIKENIPVKKEAEKLNNKLSFNAQTDSDYINYIKSLAEKLNINLAELKDQLGL